MRSRLISVVKFIIFFGTGIGILYLVFRKYNRAYQEQCVLDNIPQEDCSLLVKIINDFGTVNWLWIVAVLLLFLLSNVFRALRWNILLKPMGYRPRWLNGFFSIMIGYLANMGFPRIGEVVRAAVMSRYEKIPVETLAGTIVVSRSVDLICMLLVLVLSFALEWDLFISFLTSATVFSGEEGTGYLSWYIIGGLFIATITGIIIFWDTIIHTVFYRKLLKLWKGFIGGIKSIYYIDQPVGFVLYSVGIWLLYYLMTYISFFSYEPTEHLTPVAALVVFTFGSLGMIVPSPGGMGTYHYLISVALGMYGINPAEGFSFANILFFSVVIFCNVVFGLVAILAMPLIERFYERRTSHVKPTSQ